MKISCCFVAITCLALELAQAQNKLLQIEPPKSRQAVKKTGVTIDQTSPSGTTLSVGPDSSLTAFTEGISSTTEIQQLIDSLLQGATDVTKQSSRSAQSMSDGIGNLNIDPTNVDTITITETEIKNPNAVITKEITSLKKTSPTANAASSTNSANSDVFASLDSTLLSRFGTSPEELIAQLGKENNPSHSRSVTRHDEAGRTSTSTSNTQTSTSVSSSRRSSAVKDIPMPQQTVTDIKAIVEATRKQHELDSKIGATTTGVMGEQQVGSIVDKLLKTGKIDTASAAAFRSEPVSIQAINEKGSSTNALESFLQGNVASTNEAQGSFDINAELANILDPSFLGTGIFDALGTDQNSIPLTSQLPHSKSRGTTEFSSTTSNTVLDTPPSGSQAVQGGSPSINFGEQQISGNKPNIQFDTSVKVLEDPFQFPNDPALGNSLSVDQGLITDTGNVNNGKRAPMTNPGNLNIPESILSNNENKGNARSKVELSALQAAGVNNPNLGLGADLLQQLSLTNLVDSNTGMSSVLDTNIFGPTVDSQQNLLEVERQKGLQKMAEIEAKRRVDEQKVANRLLRIQQEQARLLAEKEQQKTSLLNELAKKQNEIQRKTAVEVIKDSNKEQVKLHKLLAEAERKRNDLNRKALQKHSELTVDNNRISMEEFKRKQLIEEEKRKRDFQEKLKKLRADAALEQKKRAERARQRQIELDQLLKTSDVGPAALLTGEQNRASLVAETQASRGNILESVLGPDRTRQNEIVTNVQRNAVDRNAERSSALNSVGGPTSGGGVMPPSPRIVPLRLSVQEPLIDPIVQQASIDANSLNTLKRDSILTPVEPDVTGGLRATDILRNRNMNLPETNRLDMGPDARLSQMNIDTARLPDISFQPEIPLQTVDRGFDSAVGSSLLQSQDFVRPMTARAFRASDRIRPLPTPSAIIMSGDRGRPMSNRVLISPDPVRHVRTEMIRPSSRVRPMRRGGLRTSSSFYSDFPMAAREFDTLQSDISRDWNRQVSDVLSGTRQTSRSSGRRMSSGFSRATDRFYPEVNGLIRPGRSHFQRNSFRQNRVRFSPTVPNRRGRFDRFSGVW